MNGRLHGSSKIQHHGSAHRIPRCACVDHGSGKTHANRSQCEPLDTLDPERSMLPFVHSVAKRIHWIARCPWVDRDSVAFHLTGMRLSRGLWFRPVKHARRRYKTSPALPAPLAESSLRSNPLKFAFAWGLSKRLTTSLRVDCASLRSLRCLSVSPQLFFEAGAGSKVDVQSEATHGYLFSQERNTAPSRLCTRAIRHDAAAPNRRLTGRAHSVIVRA